MKNRSIKILVAIASTISIGFGLWHFFVPSIWDWYSYFEESATELVLAVRAINFFFSLLLVLLGIGNMLVVFRKQGDKYSTMVLLSISAILWTTRIILQLIYPQGSQNPLIEYSMLFVFLIVWICYVLSLYMLIKSGLSEN